VAGFTDVYVLSAKRSKADVLHFLDRFLPARTELAEEYLVPQYADRPQACFDTAEQLLDHLHAHPDQAHAVYWASVSPGDPRYAMVFPTVDGQMVYGLSVERDGRKFLADLKVHLESSKGYIDFENPPPDNAADFEALAADLGGSW
jgi:hypothetical protein